jgi:pyruvate carboxylase subunit B
VKYYVEWAGRTREVEIRRVGGATEVRVDGTPHRVDVADAGDHGLMSLLLDGASYTIATRFEEGQVVLSFHDREVRLKVEDERTRAARVATGGPRQAVGRAEVKSVMPGVVKELRVAPGQAVEAGQALLILEAMKMENEVRAPLGGVVEALHVRQGQAVEKGAALLLIVPPRG